MLLQLFQKWNRSFSILLLTILLSLHATADQESTVHFVEEANWPPFTPSKNGYVKEGLSWELVSEVFGRMGVSVDLELVPQLRMLKYLKNGQKDGATVISKNPEREKYLEFSEAVFEKRGRVYYLVGRVKPIDWNQYSDLKGLRIGIVHGHSYGEAFKNASKVYDFTLDEANTVEQNFEKLLFGRVDIVLCNEWTANQYLKLDRYRDLIVPSDKNYYEKSYHIAFSKFSRARKHLPKVNDVIREMKAEGKLLEIIEKHVSP